ncbi:MAG TPA: DNA-binding protein [Bacillota bacterium]|nr:DNA-binding protein [Bacillota bacterium]HNT04312.1 DNA-binding protein [Bacillota bacterium]HNU79270.1 DNA-binding protein [Bacillota bacterium]HPA55615.1 DNA-binding protein [Bacillota bacterium]HPL98422.1 DNA-binding protein [Bacillota bacterium]
MNEDKNYNMPWLCDKCKRELVLKKVKVRYLEGNFEVDLPKCPECNMVFIDEEMAVGKMLEVEKELEGK